MEDLDRSRRTNLSRVEPREIRHALVAKLRELLKSGLDHNHGMTLGCPYDRRHFALHTFTKFNGMEMFCCHQCGYRYVMIKRDGEKLLVNMPEATAEPSRPAGLLKRRTKEMKNQDGFTLMEIIATMIILGILAALAVPRFVDLEANAKLRAIDAAASELNSREALIWSQLKIDFRYVDDAAVLAEMNARPTDVPQGAGPWLGPDYQWGGAVTSGSNQLTFKGQPANLARTGSTVESPGRWK